MPIEILSSALFEGPQVIPGWDYIVNYAPILLTVAGVKYYFGGTANTWERDMHGKVFIMTGGTSGLGAYLSYYLASKGAQLILLVRSTEDTWTVDYIEDLREKTNNELIYAEPCDLNSLYSIRKFATKWLDNKPARRLDGVICCASESIPKGKARQVTVDGVERQMGVNYLAHYHLLTLLEPSLQVQPPDRDVRVLVATCASQALAEIDHEDILWLNKRYPSNAPWKLYGTSKLLLGLFVQQYQKKLNSYNRPDSAPVGVRVNMVNPGLMRTPSTRRFLSFGSIWGLILYIILYPIWFIFLKSAIQGAQSFIFALSAPIFIDSDGGNLVQECKILTKRRPEYKDEVLQEGIFTETGKLIEVLEKQSAIERKKQEKINNSKKPLKEKLKQQNEEHNRRSNLSVKPETDAELNAKLERLRKQVEMGPQASYDFDSNDKNLDALPLFPQEQHFNKQTKTPADFLPDLSTSTGVSTPVTKNKKSGKSRKS